MRAKHVLYVMALLLAAQGSRAQKNTYGNKYATPAYSAKLEHGGISASPPMYSFPTYPAVNDYASGTCVGYAYCFATWNPPVITEPDVMCPAGYELSNSQSAPICVQKSGVCPSGFDLSSNGDCCTVKSTGQCYANWDTCSGGVAAAGSYAYSGDVSIGSVCKGTTEYNTVVDNVQLVEVTSGSKWFDGSMDGNTVGVDATIAGSEATDSSGDNGMTVQIIPSGQLVNINGQLVHVGPVPAGVPLAGNTTSGGNAAADTSGLTAAQQAALAALQQQAIQQGTYIPGRDDQGSSSSSSDAAGSSSSSNIPPATLANQQAALAALQQQAQQQGTYIAQPGSTGQQQQQQYNLPSLNQPVMPGTTPSSARLAGKVSRGSFKPPKEGLGLMTVLFMLPKIILPNRGTSSLSFTVPMLGKGVKSAAAAAPKVITDELVASKQVMASAYNKKEDFLPKCFSKCCTPDADVVCVPSSTTVNYAKPAYICPPGCTFIDNSNKCLCSSGHFTPCQPTDTVCSFGDQPICVGSKSFFGIEACKFIGALQSHLPKVQCPYSSLAKGITSLP